MKNNSFFLVLFASTFAVVFSKTTEPTYTIAENSEPTAAAHNNDLHTNEFAEAVMDRVLMNMVVPLPVDSQSSVLQHQADMDPKLEHDTPEYASEPTQDVGEEIVSAEDGSFVLLADEESTKSGEASEVAEYDGMFEPEDYEDWDDDENVADIHAHTWDGIDEL